MPDEFEIAAVLRKPDVCKQFVGKRLRLSLGLTV